jgi:hypothetical protein
MRIPTIYLETTIFNFPFTNDAPQYRAEVLRLFIEAGIIPPAYGTDGFHIASATVKGLDFIVSLNFRHIVKRKTIEKVELINFQEGYKRIGIYSPAEVTDHDENS